MELPNPYLHKDYKLLVVIPLLLAAIALFFVFQIPQGVDLKGGLLLTVYTQDAVSVDAVKTALGPMAETAEVRVFENPSGKGVEISLPIDEKLEKAEESLKNVRELDKELTDAELKAAVGNDTGVAQLHSELNAEVANALALCGSTASVPEDSRQAVALAEQTFSDAKGAYRDELLAGVQKVATVKDYSFKEIGSSLSKFFVTKTREIIIWSFVLSAIIVFIVFRSLVPSLAVIFGALADILITAGVMGLLQIPLSLATVAALLMLIGFSLDTDVLLTVRVIKRKEGHAAERAFDAMKTGFLMSATNVTAFGILFLISLWLQIPTYYQIGIVAVIGSAVDFVATWCGNAPLVLWYAENQEKKANVR